MAKKGLKIKEVTASKPEKEYCGPPPTQNDRVSSVILANINRIRQLLTWEKRLVKTNVKQTNIKRQMLSDFQIRDVRMNDSLEILRMRYERERLIRKQAEQIAEDKSSAPFVKSRELAELNQLKNKFGNCRARPATPPPREHQRIPRPFPGWLPGVGFRLAADHHAEDEQSLRSHAGIDQ